MGLVDSHSIMTCYTSFYQKQKINNWISGMKPEQCFTLEPLPNNGFSIVNVNILPGSMCSHYIDLNYTPGSINKSNLFCADAAYLLRRVRSELNCCNSNDKWRNDCSKYIFSSLWLSQQQCHLEWFHRANKSREYSI